MKIDRAELEEALRIRLNFFTQTGCKPDDTSVVKAMADYILALLELPNPPKDDMD
jgi:hypothetical protein